MPSFDAVSELDSHELTNAVDQANRELTQRFDFKDTGATFELKEKEMTVSLKAPAEFQLKQMLDILTQRLGKRGIDVRCMEEEGSGVATSPKRARTSCCAMASTQDAGRKLQKLVKESKLKVQAADQGDQLRVTGKSRRPAGRDGAAAQGGARPPAAVQQFSRLSLN